MIVSGCDTSDMLSNEHSHPRTPLFGTFLTVIDPRMIREEVEVSIKPATMRL